MFSFDPSGFGGGPMRMYLHMGQEELNLFFCLCMVMMFISRDDPASLLTRSPVLAPPAWPAFRGVPHTERELSSMLACY